MNESFFLFAGVAIVLVFTLRYLIKSESNGVEVDEKLKVYARSSLFQNFYEKYPYKRLSSVIKDFEKRFPAESEKMRQEKTKQEEAFSKNKDRYNELIFKYADELKTLKESGAKVFSQSQLRKVLDAETLDILLEANVINYYSGKYLLQSKYEVEHPFEVDLDGNPLKIEI